jgi:hypothetical protein
VIDFSQVIRLRIFTCTTRRFLINASGVEESAAESLSDLNREITDVMRSARLTGIAVAAAAALVLVITPASAQKAPPAKPETKPAPTNAAPGAAAKPKATKKAASACKGLTKSQCGATTACGWVEPKKKLDKRGRELKAYCRKVAGIAKKK